MNHFVLPNRGKSRSGLFGMSRRNAKVVTHLRATEQIPVLASILLDAWPRKVDMFSTTGRAQVRGLRKLHQDIIERRENNCVRALTPQREAPGGEVGLFA
ncbi:MAG: hypothetical protein JNM79_03725 [Burkholderiales bacterium]|nr:hypothetical protein [Burkholderiales bacterium]